MRIIKAIVIFMLCCFRSVDIHCQLLWEVSGNSCRSKSYILATNRLVDQTFADTIPNLFKCFAQCDKVITEFAFYDYEAIATLRTSALLPDSVRLVNFYSEQEYSDIDEALKLTFGEGLQQLGRMKPSYLTEMYRTELLKQWLGYNDKRSIETFFENVAVSKEMPVIGLDDIGETMYILFDREPFHWQCQELKQITEYPEREIQLEKDILGHYYWGRLADIVYCVSGPNNNSTLSFSDYKVYSKRNNEWVKRLAPYLKDGHCFITLNALYLGGEEGLLQLLRRGGYKVKAVNRHQ